MADAVSSCSDVIIKKSFFSTKAYYARTGSRIEVSVFEYAPTEGKHLSHILGLSAEKIATELSKYGKPSTTSDGNYRLEMCASSDGQFCMLQLFHYVDYEYRAVSEPLFYKGDDAVTIARLF